MAQLHKTAEVGMEDEVGHCAESETAQMERNKKNKDKTLEKELDF